MKILHPFANTGNEVFQIDSAEGYIIYHNNKKFLDFMSGLYNCPLGYSAQTLIDAINNILSILPNSHIFSIHPSLSQTNIYAEILTEKLKELIPYGKYISYTNGGAEAVDLAIRYCTLKYPDKHKIISYRKSYHGSTTLTGKISGNLTRSAIDSIYIDFYGFDNEYDEEEYIQYVEKTIMGNDPSSILCFVIEPMIGASGGFIMKTNVLPKIAELCKKYQILIVLDEVISGFGRLGEMFAFEKYDIIPDILILSKQITNGYIPFGACILSPTFNFDDIELLMGYTTSANPVACATAIAMLESIPDRSLIEDRLKYLGKILIDKNIVFKFEHAGCFAALHFSTSKKYLKFFEYNIGGEIAKRCHERGLIVRGNPRSTILAPGYYMSDNEFEYATNILQEVIDNV